MADASGSTSYTYDTRDRLLTKASPFGTLTYTYDAAGNTLTLKSSNVGGASMTYTYDPPYLQGAKGPTTLVVGGGGTQGIRLRNKVSS